MRWKCNGLDICEFFDGSCLKDYERIDGNPKKQLELFQKKRQMNMDQGKTRTSYTLL